MDGKLKMLFFKNKSIVTVGVYFEMKNNHNNCF